MSPPYAKCHFGPRAGLISCFTRPLDKAQLPDLACAAPWQGHSCCRHPNSKQATPAGCTTWLWAFGYEHPGCIHPHQEILTCDKDGILGRTSLYLPRILELLPGGRLWLHTGRLSLYHFASAESEIPREKNGRRSQNGSTSRLWRPFRFQVRCRVCARLRCWAIQTPRWASQGWLLVSNTDLDDSF